MAAPRFGPGLSLPLRGVSPPGWEPPDKCAIRRLDDGPPLRPACPSIASREPERDGDEN